MNRTWSKVPSPTGCLWLSILMSQALVAQQVVEECGVKGFEFVEAAQNSGWTISVDNSQGQGTCTVRTPGILMAASREGDGLTCNFTFFPGGRLGPKWNVGQITFAGPNMRELRRPEWPSREMSVSAEVRLAPGRFGLMRLREINLIGPSCTDWRNALLPPRSVAGEEQR